MVGPLAVAPQVVIGYARHSVVKVARLCGPSTFVASWSPTFTVSNEPLVVLSFWIWSMNASFCSSSSASCSSVHSCSAGSANSFFSLASRTW